MYEKKFKGQKSNCDCSGIRYGNVACSLRQAGWIESGGQTEQKEYVYVPEYLELDDNTNSSYSNMTVQGINCIIQITNGMKLPVRARSCLELIR